MEKYNILKQYAKEVRRYPLLTMEQEQELGRRIQRGDQEAKQRLVESNLRLVIKIAIQMNRGCVPLMDIIQNGNLGLIRAAEKFDPTRNIRFSSYAAYWIRQSILRHMAEDTHIENISVRMLDRKKHIRHFIHDFFIKNNRFPSTQELSQTMQISPFEAGEELLRATPRIHEAPPTSVEDIPDATDIEASMENQNLVEDIDALINELDEPSKNLIKMRFGFAEKSKFTLTSLATALNISAEGVRQRESRILSRLKEEKSALRYYLA